MHCRLSNISPEGTWVESESFVVAGELPFDGAILGLRHLSGHGMVFDFCKDTLTFGCAGGCIERSYFDEYLTQP